MSFWAGKKVFLTGHTGFKGGWASLLLVELGALVTGYSDEVPTVPSLFELAHLGNCVSDIRGDVADFPRVAAAMQEADPDIVIHMAAQPIVMAGYVDPLRTYSTNVMGTANVLQAAREQRRLGSVIVVTTDKCYENREWHWGYREIDELGGSDPYSNSKACSELVTSAFRRSFFSDRDRPVAVVSARAGNVIGGGDFAPDRIVPDAFRAFSTRVPLMVRNPKAIRPWQHVLEPVWGYLTLAQKSYQDRAGYAEAWNFGPGRGNEQPVRRLVNGLVELWGNGACWQQEYGHYPKETRLLRIDASKAEQRLQWNPLLDFETMLAWTAAWYRDFVGGAAPLDLTLRQIRQYLAMASSSKAEPAYEKL